MNTSSVTLNLVNGLIQFPKGIETLLGGGIVFPAAPVYLDVSNQDPYTSGYYYIDQSNNRLGVTTSYAYSYTNSAGKTTTWTQKGTNHWAICEIWEDDEPILPALYFAMYLPQEGKDVRKNCTKVFVEAEIAAPY